MLPLCNMQWNCDSSDIFNVLTAKYQGGHDDISHRNKSSEKRV